MAHVQALEKLTLLIEVDIMTQMERCKLKAIIPYLIGFLFMVVTVARGRYFSFPWCDELTFLDSAVNLLRTGQWHSETFYLVNNPLSPIVTALCTSIFGHTHEVVIGVGCFFAYLSMSSILACLHKRNVLVLFHAQILFVCLFWGGAAFSGIMTNGRPDTMVLLFTVLLLDQMFPSRMNEPIYVRVALLSFALMLVAAYTLPLLSIVSMGEILWKERRRTAIKRTCFMVVGGVVGWLCIALFYAWHHELIRFVGFYASFNSITGERFGSFLDRILAAFTYDKLAIALLLGVAVMTLSRRVKISWRQMAMFCTIALIPMLMVMCGRYQPYYAWLYYVPSCILFSIAAERCGKWFVIGMTLFVMALWLVRIAPANASNERYAHALEAEAFVAKNEDRFIKGIDVLVADDTIGDVDFYYPLLRRSVNVWFRGKVGLSELSDEKKFDLGLSLFVKDGVRRKKILEKVLKFQNIMPYLPPGDALVLFVSKENLAAVKPLIENAGNELSLIASDGERTLFSMKKSVKR